MGGASHSQQELRSVASNFQQNTIGDAAQEDLGTAGIPAEFWPTLAGDAADTYVNLLEKAFQAVGDLQEAIRSVGDGLEAVADHYENVEDENRGDIDDVEVN